MTEISGRGVSGTGVLLVELEGDREMSSWPEEELCGVTEGEKMEEFWRLVCAATEGDLSIIDLGLVELEAGGRGDMEVRPLEPARSSFDLDLLSS